MILQSWCYSVHVCNTSCMLYMYCIVGNFWGRKSSQITWFESHSRKFSSRNLACPTYLYEWFSIPRKFSRWNSHFLLISTKVFSLKYFPAAIWYISWTTSWYAIPQLGHTLYMYVWNHFIGPRPFTSLAHPWSPILLWWWIIQYVARKRLVN